MYKVIVIDHKKFQESREEWNRLVLLMNIPSIFCTWEWIYTWWEHFGLNYELRIFFIYHDEELKGILPFVLDKKNSGNRSYGPNRLTYAGCLDLYPDHLDLIGSKEEAGPCLEAVFNFFGTEKETWDTLYLSLLSEEANFLSFLNKEKINFKFQIRQKSVAPFIRLSGSFEDYMKTFDSRQRYERKRGQKKIYEEAGFKYLPWDLSNYSEGLKSLFHLHELRAKSKEINSTFTGTRLFDFHNSLANRIVKNDWLWIRFIGNEQKVISIFYGFGVGGHLFYYQLGLDPEWERYSPGKLILNEVIKEAFSKEYKEFDFLRGDEEYKFRWTKISRPLFSAEIYNKTFHGGFSQIKMNIKEWAKNIVK